MGSKNQFHHLVQTIAIALHLLLQAERDRAVAKEVVAVGRAAAKKVEAAVKVSQIKVSILLKIERGDRYRQCLKMTMSMIKQQ